MRYVSIAALHDLLPDGWVERATAALEAVTPRTGDRTKAVDEHALLWRELKPILSSLSAGKCWYCESCERRSTNAVDHFRPKSAVYEAEDAENSGYWWLAFDWENFRFSCEFCNSYGSTRTRSVPGGKRTHFPILAEETRVAAPGSIAGEVPLLLDPTRRADPSLLWFDGDGAAVPLPSLEAGLANRRADESIRIYNLNEGRLHDARRELGGTIQETVRDADYFWQRSEEGDPTAADRFEQCVARLHQMCGETAEYSAAARCTLMRLRSESPVPDRVLRDLGS